MAKKNKRVLIIVASAVLLITVITVAYAYFIATVSGNLITKAELINIFNCSTSNSKCPNTYPWLLTTSYWTGSPDDTELVWGLLKW